MASITSSVEASHTLGADAVATEASVGGGAGGAVGGAVGGGAGSAEGLVAGTTDDGAGDSGAGDGELVAVIDVVAVADRVTVVEGGDGAAASLAAPPGAPSSALATVGHAAQTSAAPSTIRNASRLRLTPRSTGRNVATGGERRRNGGWPDRHHVQSTAARREPVSAAC
jgi:hypothetical protein